MKEAIYIPAYSDGLMSMFFSKDDKQIAKENQPDFDKKKSLRIYNKDFDAYFHNPYILISAGTSWKKKDFRKTIHAENSKIFVDSGGYNLAHGTVDLKKFTDKIALEWSEANGDTFPILDRPTFTLGMMRDGKPLSPYKDYQECLDLSVNSAKYYYENTYPNLEFDHFRNQYYFLNTSRQTRLLGRWVKFSKIDKNNSYLKYIDTTTKRLKESLADLNIKTLNNILIG